MREILLLLVSWVQIYTRFPKVCKFVMHPLCIIAIGLIIKAAKEHTK
jgi:hypothetical protein